MNRSHRKKIARGFTLIELLVAMAVFIIFFMGVYSGIQFTFRVIFQSRLRVMETSIAIEEMELVHVLPYDSVGITDGTPTGVLERTSTTTQNNLAFVIRRTVRYVDDPIDGVEGGDPEDMDPDDYKFVQIDVNCDACNQARAVSVATYVAP